jgi:hypothetical protein
VALIAKSFDPATNSGVGADVFNSGVEGTRAANSSAACCPRISVKSFWIAAAFRSFYGSLK